MSKLCAACGTLGYVGGKLCEPCAGTGKIPPPDLAEFDWQCTPLVPHQVRTILAGDFHADPLFAAELVLALPFCEGEVEANGECPKCGERHSTELVMPRPEEYE